MTQIMAGYSDPVTGTVSCGALRYRLLIEELLRLAVWRQRALTLDEIAATLRGDPDHPLKSEFDDVSDVYQGTARLAKLVNRMCVEQGIPTVKSQCGCGGTDAAGLQTARGGVWNAPRVRDLLARAA
jgi:hypothetical protein